MTSVKTFFVAAMVSTVLVGGAAMARGPGKHPAQNVSAKKHPNLAAAQQLSGEAYVKVVAAQNANEYDMAGHAAKAKALLEQANAELKLAAGAANEANEAAQ